MRPRNRGLNPPSSNLIIMPMTRLIQFVAVAATLSVLASVYLMPEPLTGAYEATMELKNGQSKLLGIAIFKEDVLIADGQTAKVDHWKHEGDVLSAFGPEGGPIFEVTRTSDTELVQEIPNGKIYFRKYDLPTFFTW